MENTVTKYTKKELRKIALEKHYKNCEALALTCGIKNPNGKKLSLHLWKLELQAHKDSTDYCNGVIATDTWEIRSQAMEDVVQGLFNGNLKGLFVNGDARGYALKIDDEVTKIFYPFLHQDWGGYGILSPEIN